jgi:hypothetical protein
MLFESLNASTFEALQLPGTPAPTCFQTQVSKGSRDCVYTRIARVVCLIRKEVLMKSPFWIEDRYPALVAGMAATAPVFAQETGSAVVCGSATAEQVTGQTSGVKSVKNELTWTSV